MRVLVFIILFSISCQIGLAFEIIGELHPNIKAKVEEYAKEQKYDNIKALLEAFGINIYELDNKSLKIYNTVTISKLKIHGNLNFLESTIKAEAGFYKNSPVYLNSFENYKKSIVEFYKSKGFLDVKVSYRFVDGVLNMYIDEGQLYVLSGVKVFYGNEVVFSEKYLNPKVLSDRLLKEMEERALKKLKIEGILFPEYQTYFEKSFSRIFFDLNSPLHSIVSFLPSFHKTVNIVIKVKPSDKYKFNISGLTTKESLKAKQIVVENLKRLDSYHIGKTFMKLTEEFGDKVYFNVDKTEIYVNVQNFKRKVKYDYEITSKDISFVKPLKIDLEGEQLSSEEELREYVGDYLKGLGYYKNEMEINRQGTIFKIRLKLSEKVIIKNVYLNDKLILDGIDTPYDTKYKAMLVNEIKMLISDKYYYNYIIEDRVDYNEAENALNIYFKSDIKNITLRDTIILDRKIRKVVNKRIKPNDKITVKKIENLQYVLKNSMNITDYVLTVIEDNNSADIALRYAKPNKNYLFLDLQYNNVDGPIVSVGYKRFAIFSSEYILNSSVTFSKKEEDYLFGVSKLSKLNNFIVKFDYSANYFRKDLDDFKYKGHRLGVLSSMYGDYYKIDLGLFIEKLKVYNSVLTNDDYNKSYDMVKIPFSLNLNMSQTKISFFPFNINIDNNLLISDNFKILGVECELEHKGGIAGRFNKRFVLNIGKYVGKSDSLPVLYRYTLGGPDKMKAFSFRELGPEDSNNNVYGGNGYYHVHAGLPVEVVSSVYIEPFYEIGQIFYEKGKTDVFKDLGLSFNVDMPIGEINISYAKSFAAWGKSSGAFYVSMKAKF
ncbi:BamA/TamA family outer membrane protein [Deferribacteraceae bacterium V6Fe1]|nr:BamA/TamA family outer membrane protein [Deferribacteraceae bacterium V6Fe1]